ncbi:cation/acetate symporter ActP [Abditibacteriota bacterium]|nr:cation/acetate symporter ActP [Abditibacteriota bacterium]
MPATQLGQLSPVAIAFFFAFIGVTLGITYWAARKTKTTSEFYAAGGGISGFQNGLALAGDFMSAASFLGIAHLVATGGYDGLIYSVGYLVGWPIVMFLIAEPLRNLGKYTFADVVAYRLRQRPVKTMAAIGSITTVIIYLTAQMVGAGTLIKLMFGLEYETALLGVGVLMIAYVLFGGMLATTWVQIIKAVLLIGGATVLTLLVLNHFGWSYGNLFSSVRALPNGQDLLTPGHYKVATSGFDLVSLSLGLMFGTAGLPHILMRFYTVPNAREARKSVFVATGFIGYFYILTFTIGYGAAALVPAKYMAKVVPGTPGMGNNVAAPLLAEILGGGPFLGFLCAVAFATILAVVAGLTLAGASAISHDLYAGVVKGGVSDEKSEVRVAKTATVVLGVIAVLFGLLFKEVNVAFMVGLAFAVAASANFPALLLSVFWRKFTTQAAVASMIVGLLSAVILIVLSPTVWTDVFKLTSTPPIPLKNPAIISMPLSFLTAFVVSLLTRDDKADAAFEEQQMRATFGG